MVVAVVVLLFIIVLSCSGVLSQPAIRWSGNLTQQYSIRINAQCATSVLSTTNYTRLWLIAGQTPNNQYLTDVWRNDGSGIASSWFQGKGGYPLTTIAQPTVAIGDILVVLGQSTMPNRVWYSTNSGASWMISTLAAPWSISAYAHAVVPYINSLILTAGTGGTSGLLTWINNDGIGAEWSNITASKIAPWPNGLQNPSLVALYDGDKNHPATIVLSGGFVSFNMLYNIVYISTDYAVTWQVTVASWSPRYSHTSMADTDNYIYVYGGCLQQNCGSVDNSVFLSTDGALSWSSFSVVSTLPLLRSSCVSLVYDPIKGSPGKYNKQIVIYSGVYVTGLNQYVGAFIGDILNTQKSV